MKKRTRDLRMAVEERKKNEEASRTEGRERKMTKGAEAQGDAEIEEIRRKY